MVVPPSANERACLPVTIGRVRIWADDQLDMRVTEPTALGRLLRQRRRELGYSRARAGELAGISQSTIESWEIGRVQKPPFEDVLRMARTLGISIAELEAVVLPGGSPGHVDEVSSPRTRRGLLDEAIVRLGWSEADAAEALNITSERVRELRTGSREPSVLETMTLMALLAAFPAPGGEVEPAEVAATLARLRRAQV